MWKAIIAIVLGLSLSACNNDPYSIPEKFKPEENAAPQYFLNLHGVINGTSKKPLRLTAEYSATNKACLKTVSMLEGVKGFPVKYDNYYVDLSKPKFSMKIPVDRYLSGKCGWKLFSILLFQTKYDNSGSIFDYRNKEAHVGKSMALEFRNNTWFVENPKNFLSTLNRHKNYNYMISVNVRNNQ